MIIKVRVFLFANNLIKIIFKVEIRVIIILSYFILNVL